MDESDEEDTVKRKGASIMRKSGLDQKTIYDLFSMRRKSTLVDDRYKATMDKKRSVILSNVPEELV